MKRSSHQLTRRALAPAARAAVEQLESRTLLASNIEIYAQWLTSIRFQTESMAGILANAAEEEQLVHIPWIGDGATVVPVGFSQEVQAAQTHDHHEHEDLTHIPEIGNGATVIPVGYEQEVNSPGGTPVPEPALIHIPELGHGDTIVPVGFSQEINSAHHTGGGHPAEPNDHYLGNPGDGHHFAWVDRDVATPVIDIWYDFRTQNGFANSISAAQIAVAEAGMQLWEEATLGALNFTRNTTTTANQIINIGVGNLAAVGGASGAGGVVGIGGGTVGHGPSSHTMSSAYAWMDSAETWDNTIGNGNPLGTIDFFSIATHGIGHALVLDHSDNVAGTDMMDGTYVSELTSVSSTDVAHMQSLYNPVVAGALRVVGSEGNDTITATIVGVNLTIDYGGTVSTFSSAAVTSITIDAMGGADTVNGSSRDESIIGGGGNDSLVGNDGDDTLDGAGNNDTLVGANGDDILDGSSGNDLLSGGNNNDTMRGGSGADVFAGGAGSSDLADYLTSVTNLVIDIDNVADDGAAGEGDNVGTDTENVTSGSGADVIYGSASNNLLVGGTSDDYIDGLGGNDTPSGAGHNDTLVGGTGNDSLLGDAGNDIVYLMDSVTGNDSAWGGSGTDTLGNSDSGDFWLT